MWRSGEYVQLSQPSPTRRCNRCAIVPGLTASGREAGAVRAKASCFHNPAGRRPRGTASEMIRSLAQNPLAGRIRPGHFAPAGQNEPVGTGPSRVLLAVPDATLRPLPVTGKPAVTVDAEPGQLQVFFAPGTRLSGRTSGRLPPSRLGVVWASVLGIGAVNHHAD